MAMERCLLVCVFACAFPNLVLGQVATICRPNERFLLCGGCQKTCADPAPTCTAVCKIGCFCPEDEVRNETGHCVKLADCPPIDPATLDTSEPRTTASCPENEEYRFCEPCNKTCAQPNPICPAQCARGCFCKDGLLREKDGRCVEADKCSIAKDARDDTVNLIRPWPYQLTCGLHQYYTNCQNCEKTCSSSAPLCQYPCRAGCFCEEGYVRSPSGECVEHAECPRGSLQ